MWKVKLLSGKLHPSHDRLILRNVPTTSLLTLFCRWWFQPNVKFKMKTKNYNLSYIFCGVLLAFFFLWNRIILVRSEPDVMRQRAWWFKNYTSKHLVSPSISDVTQHARAICVSFMAAAKMKLCKVKRFLCFTVDIFVVYTIQKL